MATLVKILKHIGLCLFVAFVWVLVLGGLEVMHLKLVVANRISVSNPLWAEVIHSLMVYLPGFGCGILMVRWAVRRVKKWHMGTFHANSGRFKWGLLLAVFAAVVSLQLVAILATYLSDPNNADVQGLLHRFSGQTMGTIALVLAVFAIVFLVQTGFEEVFFRGLLAKGLVGASVPIWLSAILANILFMLAHAAPNIQWPFYLVVFLLGLGFAWAAHRTGGLEVPWGLHFGNNFVAGALMGELENGKGFEVTMQELMLMPVYFLVLFGLVELARAFWPGVAARSGPAFLRIVALDDGPR